LFPQQNLEDTLVAIGLSASFSITIHPQIEGQTEVVNHTLGHSLHIYHNKNKQMGFLLHVLQHSYNHIVHVSTSHLPFNFCYGYHHLAPYELLITLPLIVSSTSQ